MAKLTKKNDEKFLKLNFLFHQLIQAKHANKRHEFEEIIEKIKEEVNKDE